MKITVIHLTPCICTLGKCKRICSYVFRNQNISPKLKNKNKRLWCISLEMMRQHVEACVFPAHQNGGFQPALHQLNSSASQLRWRSPAQRSNISSQKDRLYLPLAKKYPHLYYMLLEYLLIAYFCGHWQHFFSVLPPDLSNLVMSLYESRCVRSTWT